MSTLIDDSLFKPLIDKKVRDFILRTKHNFLIMGEDLPELASSASILTTVIEIMNEQILDALVDDIKSGDLKLDKLDAGQNSRKTINDVFDKNSCSKILKFINDHLESEYQNGMSAFWDGDEPLRISNVALISRIRQLSNYDCISDGLATIINDIGEIRPGPSEALKDVSVLKTLAEIIAEKNNETAEEAMNGLVIIKALYPDDFHMGLMNCIIHREKNPTEEFNPGDGLVIDHPEM